MQEWMGTLFMVLLLCRFSLSVAIKNLHGEKANRRNVQLSCSRGVDALLGPCLSPGGLFCCQDVVFYILIGFNIDCSSCVPVSDEILKFD